MRKISILKPAWIISLLIILVILISAFLIFSGKKDKATAEKFIKTFYSVKYSSNLKGGMTDIETIAKKNKCNITVDKLVMVRENESDKTRSQFRYTMDLKITYIDGKPKQTIQQTGIIVVVNENGTYKIIYNRVLDGQKIYTVLKK